MDQRPAAHGGHHEITPAPPASARARLAAAVRDDRAHGRPGPSGGAPAEDTPPRLPPEDGLEPVRRLGARSWLVREARSGEHFVLRPCPEEPGPEPDRSRAAALSLAVALAGREDPCLVAVRGLLGPAAAPVGLVEDFVAGGSLADRLAERGRLEPAEAAAVLRDAATGLAALHALGRCHGELSARQVLLLRTTAATDGAGLRAAVRAGTGGGSPAEDVRALGAVGWAALTGRAPARQARHVPLALLCPGAPAGLVRAVEAALQSDPSARPTAAELAGLLVRDGEPTPRGPGSPAAGPARPRAGRRRAVLAVALLLAAGSAALLLSGDGDPFPATTAGPAVGPDPAVSLARAGWSVPLRSLGPGPLAPGSLAPGPTGGAGPGAGPGGGTRQDPADVTDPRKALRVLVARRGEALRTGDARLLEEVYAAGSETAAADRDTIARGAGVFSALELEVGSIHEAPAGSSRPGTVALVAEVRVEGYPGEPGAAPSVVPAGDGWVQTVLVVLAEGEHGWRLTGVEAVAGPTVPPDPEQREPARRDPARQDPRG
ncbi:hypothetical protein AVL61_09900 [Kocuria rosea subsp. polaris]|uniref:Protein kinase domain-containing protein n=1 Tax=Kocuria rosea subsp. polaris TaxID=136273 RepID=A0A0W8ILQ8_KOCRO|nr:protein kinase [Kocuria polaris]KUG60925.1 hypothetical protein AVL61_09900 [Kocuria polaris]